MGNAIILNVEKGRAGVCKKSLMVPMTGLEPALPKKTDFESVASTNSATSAL